MEILAVENVLLNPPFNSSVTHYRIEVANEIDSLNVSVATGVLLYEIFRRKNI